MPHRGRSLRWSALPWFVAAGATCGACSPRGTSELTIILDTIPPARTVEALVLPADPSPLLAAHVRPSPSLRRATADSIARYHRLTDSSHVLDARFQLLRDSLNRDARALDGEDRRTRVYADRYFAFRRREMEAETMRRARDGLRSRTTQLRTRLAAVLPKAPAPENGLRAKLDALRADGRRARALPFAGQVIVGTLEPGSWWVGVSARGGVPEHFQQFDLRPFARDTLRLSGSPPG